MLGATVLHYRIVANLGEGGMGVVYKAEDTRLERTVALKFLAAGAMTEDSRRRLLQEARAAARVQHPNICPIFEIGEDEGRLFFAMAFVEGQTLAQLAAVGTMPITTALELAIGILSGLDAAHRQGIVHRDIKSGNIVVDRQGNPSILDFGIALRVDDERATVTGGTPTGYTTAAPALTGSVSFAAGSAALGSCTLSSGTCSKTVDGSALQAGPNSVTATFSGSGTYPSSTSSIVTVTVTSSTASVPAQVTATPFVYNRANKTFNSTYTIKNVSAGSYAGPIDLVLTKLSAGVTVANATGTYNGSPYLAVSTTALAAGASVSVAVEFSDPTDVAISPTPVVYSGAL